MNYISVFLKGLAMGAADVVPGISGGTIAFITGIYDTLLTSIRRINPSIFRIWKSQGCKAVFLHVNGFFLLSLLTGILISIISFSKIITFLLHRYPIPLWSFFFGLIVISVYHMLKQIHKKNITMLIALLLGAGLAYGITVLNPIHLEPTPLILILSGAIAICAMILPGISGSFILLLIGMYSPILTAVKSADISTLSFFVVGCALGLLTFSHLLSWLLKSFRDLTLAMLTGLMIGTLPKIWPWKETLSWRLNSVGENVPLIQKNLSPFQFEKITSEPSYLAIGIALMLFACVLVLGLEKYTAWQASKT